MADKIAERYFPGSVRMDCTAVLENDLIAQSFLPAISSRPKTTERYNTQWRFLAEITKAEFFANKKKL
jgi:hypothetical protein